MAPWPGLLVAVFFMHDMVQMFAGLCGNDAMPFAFTNIFIIEHPGVGWSPTFEFIAVGAMAHCAT